MRARVSLPVLMAAAMTVHVAIRADIDQHVETVLAAAKSAQQIVARCRAI